jgi:hypothetical protein
MPQPTLQAWLKEFPRRATEERVAELEGELSSLREALTLHDSLSKPNGSQSADEPGAPTGRRDAIRRVLREQRNQPMASGEIKRAMLDRGWMTPEQDNLFYAAISTMAKRGHLLRLEDGRYMLPPAKGAVVGHKTVMI